jgi:hypothetical protein
MIDPGHPRLSIVRQCELVSIGRSSFYREATPESAENLVLMRLIDEQFLETPWYGSRQMARHLRRDGWCVGRSRFCEVWMRNTMRNVMTLVSVFITSCQVSENLKTGPVTSHMTTVRTATAKTEG